MGMKPSSSVTYAIKALVDLALHQATGPVTVKSIARRQGIPLRYLEQLFSRLRREGIVAAERGPRGGYFLKKSPKELPVSLIFRSLEKVEVLGRKVKTPPPKPAESDPAASIWSKLEGAIQTTLEATTLEQLVLQARENSLVLNHRLTFHI